MSEKKQYDLLMNMLTNQESTIDNLITSGLSAENTSLQDKDVYATSLKVRLYFENEQGEFDKTAFDAFYKNAKIAYNYMAQTSFDKAILNLATYFRDNLFADPKKIRLKPEFLEIKTPNPLHLKSGIITPGITEERTMSDDELMQANKVLLNPTTAGENLENAQWGAAPNDNFWGYSLTTLVLARYDSDGEHLDALTGKMVPHLKGELKLDDTGNYYYETLDGRNIYDKIVLNKANILTRDGSWANSLDFFDSDDLKKSVGGSLVKNAVLLGSMFLPYVGPVIAGASIATLLVGLFGTLGKMATATDSSIFSNMEGFAKSWSRLGNVSQYAKEHPWSLENCILLMGDVFALLKEQRFIFEKIPALFKGASLVTKANEAKRLKELTDKHFALLKTDLATMKNSKTVVSGKDVLEKSFALNARARSAAQRELDEFVKSYYKIGEIISRGYMTAITVGDTYGEAIAAGASNLEATLLTMGYALFEYKLLQTGLGRWNIPETNMGKYRNEAIAKALTTIDDKVLLNAFQTAKLGLLQLSTKEGKKSYVKQLLNIGKNIAKDVWTAERANGTAKKTFRSAVTNGLAEGLEETTEEFLADFSKGCFNVIKWLQGDDLRLNTFGYDFKKQEWNGEELRDRYLLSFIGGLAGGSLTGVTTNYQILNSYNSMTNLQAVEQLVYLGRNGELNLFMKDVNKITLDDTNLSVNYELINNEAVFNPGTKLDNRDATLKKAILQLVDIVQNLLNAEGAVSDNEFLDILTLRDLRFAALKQSTTAGAFILEYNSLLSNLLLDLNLLSIVAKRAVDTNNNNVIEDREVRELSTLKPVDDSIKAILKRMKETKAKIAELVSGKRSLEFMNAALYETTDIFGGLHAKVSFPLFLLAKYRKKIEDITEEERNLAAEEYEVWKVSSGRDLVRSMSNMFLELSKVHNKLINSQTLKYVDGTTKELQDLEKMRLDLDLKIRAIGNDAFIQAFEEWLAKPGLNENVVIPERVGSVKVMDNESSSYAFRLLEVLGTEEQKAELKKILDEKTKALSKLPKETTKEEKDKVSHGFNVRFQELINTALLEGTHNLVLPFLDRGFINTETRNLLVKLLTQIKQNLVEPVYFNEEENNFFLENKYSTVLNLIIDDIKDLQKLSNTPVEDNLDEFAIALGKEPIKITELMNKVNAELASTTDNISNFLLEGVVKEVDNAINTMLLYIALILASRTDNISTQNVWGYNATLNEVSKKLGQSLDLAEIDSKTADVLLEDVYGKLNRLKLLKKLYLINQGLKLSKLERVGVRKDLLFYERLNYLSGVLLKLTDWDKDSISELSSVIASLDSRLKMLSDNNNTFSEEFLKGSIELEDAVYKFFNNENNINLLRSPEKLAQLIHPKNLGLYTLASEILNEGLEAIDDNSVVWWLASRAALKSSDFHGMLGDTIIVDTEKPIAPIATLEAAIYNNVANIVNGDIFTNFMKAFLYSIKEDWKNKSSDERKLILKKLGKPESLLDDKFVKYADGFLPIPRYTNVVLTEGIPGSGKTSAVAKGTIEILKKIDPKMLDNIWVAHGISELSAEDIVKVLNTGKALNRTLLMKLIGNNWSDYQLGSDGKIKIPDNLYEITSDGSIRSKLKINNVNNPPSLILIDEISQFTTYDLDIIDKFARAHGITVLAMGDFDQSSISGTHKLNNELSQYRWQVELDRTLFIRSPKLGVSMRTDNMLKTKNLINALLLELDNVLSLDYTENEEGLFGDKVILYECDIARNSNNEITGISSDKSLKTKLILDEVEKLAKTLKKGEKIGYIYTDNTSDLYKELSKKSYIDTKLGISALGQEGRYYIIDVGISDDKKKVFKDLYTGISRASLGSLIIAPAGKDSSFIKFNNNKVENAPIKEAIPPGTMKNYILKRKDLLLKLFPNITIPKIIKRLTSGEETLGLTGSGLIGLGLGATKEQIEALLKKLLDDAKRDLLTKIANALSELEINDLISKCNFAQLASDLDIINAKNIRLAELVKPLTTITIPEDEFNKKYPSNTIKSISINVDGVEIPLSLKLIPFISLETVNGLHYSGVTSVINYNGKNIALVDIDGFILPFYLRTEAKNDLEEGHWYPMFGLTTDSTLDILEGHSIIEESNSNYYAPKYYNNKTLELISKTLDATFGADASAVKVDLMVDATTINPFFEAVNLSFDDTENNDSTIKNIDKTLEAVDKGITTLKNKFKVPDNTIPDDDDEDIIIDLDIIDEEKYTELLDLANQTKFLPGPVASLDKTDESIVLDLIYSTFHTLEPGAVEGLNGEVVLLGTDESKKDRIDSINGLLRVDRILGNNEKLFKDYVKLLVHLRNIIFNTEKKADIDEEIKQYLGLSDIYTTFAFKSSPFTTKKDRDKKLDKDGFFGRPSPYRKSIYEKILFNMSLDKYSDEFRPKEIVLIVGTKANKDILEIPLFGWTSPFTALFYNLMAFNEVLQYFDLLATKLFNDWQKHPNDLDLSKISFAIVEKFKDSVKYRDLINLFKIFNTSGGYVKYIRDQEWTPFKNLTMLGGSVSTEKGVFQLAEGYEFDADDPTMEWCDLRDFATPNEEKYGNKLNPHHLPERYVTPIFLSETPFISDIEEPVLNAGHPFILVDHTGTFDNDTDVIELWIKQLRTKNTSNPEPEKVSLIYIRPPLASIREYLDNVIKVINKEKDILDIGYFSTSYKILNTLMQDVRFHLLATKKLGDAYAKLEEVLSNIPEGATNLELKVYLKLTADWHNLGYGNSPLTLHYLFRKVLYNLYYKDNLTVLGNSKKTVDEDAINLITTILENNGITSVYYHFSFPKRDTNKSNDYFIIPDLDNYTVNGKPCHIHAKVDSVRFSGQMGIFFDLLANSLNSPDGFWNSLRMRTSDNIPYLKKDSNIWAKSALTLQELEELAKLRMLNNLINRLLRDLGNEFSNIDTSNFNLLSKKQLLEDVANLINEKTTKLALLCLGDLLISDANMPNKVIYSLGEPITDISDLLETDGIADFEISIDGVRYAANFSKNELTYFVLKNTIPFELLQLGITLDNTELYLNEGKELLSFIFDMEADDDLLEAFNASTYGEFLEAVKNMDAIPPIPDVSGEEGMRIFLLKKSQPQTDLQKQILQDLINIEENKNSVCPEIKTIKFNG